jgi:hypothetical protein
MGLKRNASLRVLSSLDPFVLDVRLCFMVVTQWERVNSFVYSPQPN